MSIVYLNGEYLPATEAKISVFDRGFLFGDSVYEVIPFYQGIGFRLSEHLTRLEYSLRALQIKPHLQWEPILERVGAPQWRWQSLSLPAGNPRRGGESYPQLRRYDAADGVCLLHADQGYLHCRCGRCSADEGDRYG